MNKNFEKIKSFVCKNVIETENRNAIAIHRLLMLFYIGHVHSQSVIVILWIFCVFL